LFDGRCALTGSKKHRKNIGNHRQKWG
jgi:hypothetical protein